MQNANETLPAYKRLVLADDPAQLASMDLDEAARLKVFCMCSLLASARDPKWVSLLASWGFDLNIAPLVSNYSTSKNWLWNALRQGKTEQALALVRAGFFAVDVDANGQSGLGLLVGDTHHDGLGRLLGFLSELGTLGLGWQDWPDALDFDAKMRKNVGASLGDLLSSRNALSLSQYTAPADAQVVPVRL